MKADTQRHGNHAAYSRHRRSKKKICDECRAFMRDYNAKLNTRRDKYGAERKPCWRCGVPVAADDQVCRSCRILAARPINPSPEEHALPEGAWVLDGRVLRRVAS